MHRDESGQFTGFERRIHPRVRMAAIATLFSDGAKLGAFLVRNISVGGALLSGYARVTPGKEVDLALEFVNAAENVEVRGEVLRCEQDVEGFALLGIAFRNLQVKDRQVLEGLVRDELIRPHGDSVILVDARVHCLSALAEKVRLRRHSNIALARTPFEAMRCLHHETERNGAVLVARTGQDPWALQVLAIIADDFPTVRRVLVSDDVDEGELASFRVSGYVQEVLATNFTTPELIRAIGG